MNKLKLNVKTATWFSKYVAIQKDAALEAAKQGAPIDFVKDQFESNVRSAAFDAVEIGGFEDEQPGE